MSECPTINEAMATGTPPSSIVWTKNARNILGLTGRSMATRPVLSKMNRRPRWVIFRASLLLSPYPLRRRWGLSMRYSCP